VGRRGDELLPRQLELGELLLHVIEGDRELAELVGGVNADRVAEVTRRHLLGRQLEPLDALGQGPSDQIPADQRQQQRNPAGDEDLVPNDRHAADDV
jgi:hypothetical protein